MTTAYTKARRELADRLGPDDDGNRLPCMTCKVPTVRETLSQYGARCFSCYEAYCCGHAQPFGPVTPSDKREILAALREVASRLRPPLEWAHRLRSRDDAGDRLTPTQRSMYRQALASKHGLSATDYAP